MDVGSTVEAFETLSAGGVASGIALFFPPAEVATCSVTAIGAIECVGAIVLSVNDIAKIDKSYGGFSEKVDGCFNLGPKEKLTAPNAKVIAEKLGFKKIKQRVHDGQPVFYNAKTKKYISPDYDRHNGGVWKMADSVKDLASKETRYGTLDINLNKIGD